jgi:hypothetical protein
VELQGTYPALVQVIFAVLGVHVPADPSAPELLPLLEVEPTLGQLARHTDWPLLSGQHCVAAGFLLSVESVQGAKAPPHSPAHVLKLVTHTSPTPHCTPLVPQQTSPAMAWLTQTLLPPESGAQHPEGHSEDEVQG